MAEYNQPSGQPLPVNPSNKYFGEQDVRHPGQLHWPGVDGYPFLGDEPPLLRQNELQRVPIVGFSYLTLPTKMMPSFINGFWIGLQTVYFQLILENVVGTMLKPT